MPMGATRQRVGEISMLKRPVPATENRSEPGISSADVAKLTATIVAYVIVTLTVARVSTDTASDLQLRGFLWVAASIVAAALCYRWAPRRN